MSAPTRWWWVRHAPIPGAAGRIHGQLDVDCDVSDLATLEALAEILPGEAVWVVTPLVRTQATFAAIHAFRPALPDPLIEPGLAEQNFGSWQGMTWAEMEAGAPDVYRRFWQDPTRNAPPGGESFAALMARCGEAITRLTARFDGRDIIAVAHGGTIRAAVALALGLSPEAAMAVVIDTLSLTRLDHVDDDLKRVTGGVWRVRGVNMPCRWIPSDGLC